jgi:8-oxo-dGTP pyrophosphatase MutT (NUDIX family)
MSSREHPIDRPTARIILIGPDDRTLLFTVNELDQDEAKPFWFPPGGGLDGDETYEQGAARELWEETGLVLPLGPCVWTRQHVWSFRESWYRSLERYYVSRVTAMDITTDNWTEIERQMISEHRWWSAEEIAASKDLFVPRSLAKLLPPILAGTFPMEPFEVDV